MELKEVASIAGKPGLFRILKPTYNGVVVETMDGQKKKMAVSASSKVSILKEISIYTTHQEGSVALQEVLCRIFEKYAHNLPITSKADTADLMNFIGEIVPDYDQSKVYSSDIKKLVTWYGIISANAVELLERVEEKAEEVEKTEEIKEIKEVEEVEKVEEVKAETKETKTKAKAEPKTKEPKETKAKAEPKEVKAKEPKEVKAKAEPKEAKAEPKPKAEPKAKAEPKPKAEPKEKKTTEKKTK